MTTDATPATARTSRLAIGVLIVFGLFYAYDLFEAVQSLVVVPGEVAARNEFLGLDDPVPWGGLIAATVLPPVVFAIAARLGRRRSAGALALLLLVGLALVAALTLSIAAYVRAGGL